jgi:outer membrane protein OmpA-like peptidoglycan-associated protein
MKKTLLALILSSLTVGAYAQNNVVHRDHEYPQKYNLYNANSNEKNHQLNLNAGSVPYVNRENLEIPESEMRKINGFVIDSRGHAVRSTDGRCVITGFYDPATAYHPECTPTAVEPTPVILPAPVAVAEVTQPTPVVAQREDTLRINFEFDSSRLTSQAQDQITNFLNNNTRQNDAIHIIAGADFMGSNKYNRSLSQRRAKEIKDFVESKGFNHVEHVKAVGERHAKRQNDCEKTNREQLIECISDDRFGLIKIMTE